MLYLKNGYLIDPASNTEGFRDLMIQDGKIARILPQGTPVEDVSDSLAAIDLSGQYIIPGLVDVHVHFRDPGFTYKEGDNFKGCAEGETDHFIFCNDAKADFRDCRRISKGCPAD